MGLELVVVVVDAERSREWAQVGEGKRRRGLGIHVRVEKQLGAVTTSVVGWKRRVVSAERRVVE